MKIPSLTFSLLFVDSPAVSAEFYSKLFGQAPAELSPTFAMFVSDSGHHLGLWSKHTAEPTPTGAPGSSEIAFTVDDVDAVFAAWQSYGVSMRTPPHDLDFGRTFVATDPDGHRIRVFCPGEA